MKNEQLIIYTDGGSRGNPGPAGFGVVFYDAERNIISEFDRYIGVATNNQAEYQAIVFALEKAAEAGAHSLSLFLDSELAVKQLNGEYKVKNKDLASLFLKIHNLKTKFSSVSFTHVRREHNKEADRLANQAMDRGK
jgi:ribonuclease HI